MSDSNFEFFTREEFAEYLDKVISSDLNKFLESQRDLVFGQPRAEGGAPSALPGDGFAAGGVELHDSLHPSVMADLPLRGSEPGAHVLESLTGEQIIGSLRNIPDYSVREYTKDFPGDFDPSSLLALVDTHGNLVNPRDPSHINKLLEGIFAKEEYGERVTDGFLNGIGRGGVQDVSEVSARLMNVLNDLMKKNGLNYSLMDDGKRLLTSWMDVVKAASEKEASPQRFMTILEMAANPGLYERIRSLFIASMNYRVTQMAIQKNDHNETMLSYDTLFRMAYSCASFAFNNAKATLRIDQTIQHVQGTIKHSFELGVSRRIVQALDANQKTVSLYGKTIRLKPGMNMADQIQRIRDGYVPWVNKQLDTLESRGLSSVLAAAIARGDGRDSVTTADIKAAGDFIKSARTTPGQFDSLNGVLTRLSGDSAFADQAGRFLTANTRKQGAMSEISALGAKLAMHRDLRTRVNAGDRITGQALAANAILKAGGRLPGVKAIGNAMSDFGLSVKRSIEAGRKIRGADQGMLSSLRRMEEVNLRRQVDMQMRARQQLGKLAATPEPVKQSTPEQREKARALLLEAARRHQERQRIKPAPGDDEVGGPKR